MPLHLPWGQLDLELETYVEKEKGAKKLVEPNLVSSFVSFYRYEGLLASLLGARTLLGAPGLTTRSNVRY